MDIKGFRDDINEQFVCRLVTAECFSRIHGWWCWDLRCRAPAKLLPRSDTPLCLTLPSDRWSPCVLPPSLPPLPCPWRPLPVCRETALRESWDEQDVQLYDSTKERILEMIQVFLWNYAFYFFHRRNVHSTCEYCTAWKSRGQIKAKRTWDEAQSCGFSRCCNKCLLSFHLSCLKLLHFFFKLWMKTALGQNALRKWLLYEEDFCT